MERLLAADATSPEMSTEQQASESERKLQTAGNVLELEENMARALHASVDYDCQSINNCIYKFSHS